MGLRLVLTFLQWLILCGETGAQELFSAALMNKMCAHIEMVPCS